MRIKTVCEMIYRMLGMCETFISNAAMITTIFIWISLARSVV